MDSTSPQLQPLAEITDYAQLVAVFRQRAQARQIVISGSVNEVAGLPQNYLGKLLSPKAPRRIGALSLGPILGVLGLKLLVVADEAAVRRYDAHIDKHKRPIRAASMEWRVSCRAFHEMQAKGRKARWSRMTAEQRSEWAREMNRIRWAKRSEQSAACR